MFGLTDRGNGNVLVWRNLHGCDRQKSTNHWKTKTLVNKPKQEPQRGWKRKMLHDVIGGYQAYILEKIYGASNFAAG